MTVEVIERPVVREIVEYCQRRLPKLDFKIEGQPSLFDGRMWLFPVITELVTNCAEAGAKSVTARIENERLTVEDDVSHENPEAILTNLNQLLPKSTKNRPVKGEGLWNARQTLARHGGELRHHAKKGKIIAVVTWKE